MRMCLLATLLLLAQVATAAQEPDPFYGRLLRTGSDAYQRGDYATASKELRIAVFGFLDHPNFLARGLGMLALAQYGLKDYEGMHETFLRLAEVEERFQAYSNADIPAGLRREIEQSLLAALPEATLEASVAFEPLVTAKWEKHFAGLDPKERRKELEKRKRDDPEEARWHLMLAQLALSDKQATLAVGHATSALGLRPNYRAAYLVRGMAYCQSRMWEEAVADLVASQRASQSVASAEALIYAYVYAGRAEDATAFVATLPDSVRENARIARLASQIPKATISGK